MANVGFDSFDEIKDYIQFDYKLTEEKHLKNREKYLNLILIM